MLKKLLITPIVLGALVAACSANTSQHAKGDEPWNYTNDPDRFSFELNYALDELPRSGRAEHEAWPSTYWPTYEDSINHRWLPGSLSPAEKYDKAFNNWQPEPGFENLKPFSRPKTSFFFEDEASSVEPWDEAYYQKLGPLANHVSQNMGNRKDREASLAATDNDGIPERWPVETWFGLCHAWVPAAMLEDRPLRAVEHNGVRFEVADVEALMIAAYNRSGAKMLGGRCNDGHGRDDRPGTTVERDEDGRITNRECRDTNAGSFHVIMTNYLGINKEAFAEDRTFDYQVWNQPVVAFEVTKQNIIDLAAANALLNETALNETGNTYRYNADAVSFVEVEATVTYLSESEASTMPADASRHEKADRYSYILELDSAGDIIGGEWTGSSIANHPDFLWSPRRSATSSVPHLDLDDVRMLIDKSRADGNEPGTDSN